MAVQRQQPQSQRLRVMLHVQRHRCPDADMPVPDVESYGLGEAVSGGADRMTDGRSLKFRYLRPAIKYPAGVQAGLLFVYMEGGDHQGRSGLLVKLCCRNLRNVLHARQNLG